VAKLSQVLDRVFEVAEARDGYFAVGDVRVRGVSDPELFRLMARGDIERVNRGVYRLVRFPRSQHGDLWAALLWAQPAVLSHATALRLHGLFAEETPFIEITVPADSRLRKEAPPHYHLYQASVDDGDRETIDGLSVTNVQRTILDVFVEGSLDRSRLRRVVELAADAGRIDASTSERLHALVGSADLFLAAAKLHAERERSQRNESKTPHLLPVRVVGERRLEVSSPQGSGSVPIFSSHDIDVPHATIERALVLAHGALRDADVYYQLGETVLAEARVSARTILLVPQMLAKQDVRAHGLSSNTLCWETWQWMGGAPAAVRSAKTSSYYVLDAVLGRLCDRSRFPALKQIILAGHSAGGQFVHRYAILSKLDQVRERGVGLSFIVANASSYTYFDATRPAADGGFAPFDASACPEFNRWKYGLQNLPSYGAGRSAEELERDYVARDVTYLLGAKDADPEHPSLDRSCAAMAQGPHRYARGHAYFEYLTQRNPESLRHRIVDVPGIGHDSNGMFTSTAGIETLFGR